MSQLPPVGFQQRRCSSSCSSMLQSAWASLKRRHIEKLLPSLIFDDQLPRHVFLGKEVLQLQVDSETANGMADCIDKELEDATRGRTVSDISMKELKDLDWSLLTAVQTASPEVSGVAQYLLHAPSKRFRPLLLLLVHRALLQCVPRESIAASANPALPLVMVQVAELIHTARSLLILAEYSRLCVQVVSAVCLLAEADNDKCSLMHDDVLDEAPTRRGKPAAHSVFGNKKAILGGDFVLARANGIAACVGCPEVCLRISQAVESLVKGELLQALTNTSDLSKAFATMLAKSYHKTASLMAETCACLALIGGYSREWVEWSHELGTSVGLAFQLYDDELDLLSSSKALGKPVNSDLKAGVVTAPLLLAAQEHPGDLLPLLQRRLRGPGDAALAEEKIRDSAAIARSRLLSRLYVRHFLQLLQRLPQTNQQQQTAAADLSTLLLWAVRRTDS